MQVLKQHSYRRLHLLINVFLYCVIWSGGVYYLVFMTCFFHLTN